MALLQTSSSSWYGSFRLETRSTVVRHTPQARLSFCSDSDFMLLSAFHRTNGSRSPIANDVDALEGWLRRSDLVLVVSFKADLGSEFDVRVCSFSLSFSRLCEDLMQCVFQRSLNPDHAFGHGGEA